MPVVSLLGIPDWESQGPGPVINGQVENIASTGPGVNPVAGAIHAIALHPNDSNIAYLGSVSGGVFRTTNFAAANPTYTAVTDQFANTSIGALVFDPTDASSNTLYAGIGSFSSFNSGLGVSNTPLGTLLRTTDGGNTWTQLATATPALGGLAGVNVSGIVARGNTILVTANNLSGGAGPGVYRSTNGGASFQLISGTGAGATPLGAGAAFDIVNDPTAANRVYVAVQGVGIFRTDDFTAANITWANVSQGDVPLNTQITATNPTTGGLLNNNTEMAVANNGRIYAAAMVNGQVRYIGFSDNQGGAWTEMDLPVTTDTEGTFALQPREHPGGQGNIHFSIVVDPNTPTTVYVGGDRQPQDNDGTNALGATDFSGRLFRGDTTVAAANPGSTTVVGSPQWEHLTHTQNATFNGGGSNNNSAPHADSRDMAFRADGVLVEADDGGIYGRTNPQNNTGGWFSLNSDAAGGLRVTEIHDIAYDNNSDIILSGNQDIGSTQQTATGSDVWTSIPRNPAINFTFGNDNFSVADGGDVVVDNQIGGGQSLRYFSTQNLGFNLNNTTGVWTNSGTFLRQVYGAGNNLVNQATPALNVPAGTPAPTNWAFVTPIAVNEVAGDRLIIGAGNGVYESTDRGDNLAQVSTLAANRNAISYGASQNGAPNPNALFVGSGNQVLGRTAAGNLNATTALPAGPGGVPAGTVTDVEMNPANFNTVIAVDNSRVYMTTDAGTNWVDITGNLADTNLRSIEYVPNTGTGPDAILVGGAGGVFRMLTNNPNVWSEFGNQLPNSVAYDMDYDAADDIVVVGTLGRGAFSVGNLDASVFVTGVVQIDGDTDFPGQDDTIRLVRNPNNPSLLEIYLNSPTPTEVVTLSAVQQINVNGWGGNDTLIVDSTNGLINVPNGLRYNGGTGVDNLRLDQTGGPTRPSATYDLGPAQGSGRHTINGGGTAGVQTVFFEDLAPVVDLVPAGTLVVNATPAENAINYTAGSLLSRGRVTVDEHESIEFANKGTLVVNALVGNDVVNLNNPATPTGLTRITVNAGDGEDVVTTLAGLPTAVLFNGEDGNDSLSAAGVAGSAVVNGGTGNDLLVGGPGDDLLAGGAGEDVLDARGGSNDLDGGADADTILVRGTAGPDTITAAHVADTFNITGGLSAGSNTIAGVEAVRVEAGDGADAITLTLSAAGGLNYTVLGGNPIGTLGGDSLRISSAAVMTVTAGPENDAGSVDAATATPTNVSFDEIELLILDGGGGGVINGTNGNDAITVIARDESYNPAADGIRDFTAVVNNGLEVLYLNQPTLAVNALGGSDTIVIRTPAPNNAVWDVDVTVDGGPPSAGTPEGSDRVVVETPGLAAEAATYNPTAADGGALDLTTLSSLITLSQIEELLYDGEGDNDTLTVFGTDGDDAIVHTPGATDQAGAFRVNGLLPIGYENLGAGAGLTAAGVGGSDTLVVVGTGADDTFRVPNAAGNVALNTRLVLAATGIETLTMEGLAGDDLFDLVPVVTSLAYGRVNANGGAQASATGDRTALRTTGGGDQIGISGQVVTVGGKTVASSGVENIALNAAAGTDVVTYTGVPGVAEAINFIAAGGVGQGQVSVPGVTLVTFTGVERLVAVGNTGAAGDEDTLTFTGTNAVDRLRVNLAAAGTAADPVLRLMNAAGTTTLLTLFDYTNFNTLRVNTLEGNDVVNVLTAATGPNRNLFVDGGIPTGKNKGTDVLNVYYAPRRPRIVHSAATQNPDSGLVTLDYDTAFFSVQYESMEDVNILRL